MARGFSSTLSTEKLRELAQTGAEVVLKRLRAEIIAIERAFPELALPRNGEPYGAHSRRRRIARLACRRPLGRLCPFE
jgi:hypothetical protein